MKHYKKSFELKNIAKDKLMGKYGFAILITFLNTLISQGISLFISSLSVMTENSVFAMTGSQTAVTVTYLVFYLISFVASAVTFVLNLGVAYCFLSIACDRPCSVKDLFYGFRNQSNKALTISALLTFISMICNLPYQLLLNEYLSSGSTTMLLYAVLAMAVGYAILIPISLALSQIFYLMLDFPGYTAKETLKFSIRVMHGRKRSLFYIQMSFIPLMLLCLLSFGIGFLWLVPYMEMTYAQFFLDNMNPKTDTISQ